MLQVAALPTLAEADVKVPIRFRQLAPFAGGLGLLTLVLIFRSLRDRAPDLDEPSAHDSRAPIAGASTPSPRPEAPSPAPPAFPCPPHSLPDRGVCIPVPPAHGSSISESDAAQLSLLPGRDPDYASYQTPIASFPARVASDGRGLFIAAPPDTAVLAVTLEGQIGQTELLASSASGGSPLLTLHHVARGAATRHYVLAHDGVSSAAGLPPSFAAGTRVAVVARTPSGASGLTLLVRQLRRGVDAKRTPAERLLRDSHSVDCDPRNVLQLTQQSRPAP